MKTIYIAFNADFKVQLIIEDELDSFVTSEYERVIRITSNLGETHVAASCGLNLNDEIEWKDIDYGSGN